MDTRYGDNWIVVGVDGSPQARNGLRWALRLSPLLGAEIAVVHGSLLLDDLGGAFVPPHVRRELVHAIVERDWCRGLVPAERPCRVDVRACPAVDAIIAETEDLDAGLVVVGTRGRRLARRQAIGSTALHLLQRLAHTTVPALVVPEATDAPAMELRRLLVGVDGSAPARSALAWAIDLAALTGATCDVVAAAEDAAVFPLGPSATVTSEGETGAPGRLRALADEWCEPLRLAGITHRVVVQRGPAAPTLVTTARVLAADMLVVGSSGVGSAGNPLLGSVSRHVAHAADRPVAVVPAHARLRRSRHVPTAAARRDEVG